MNVEVAWRALVRSRTVMGLLAVLVSVGMRRYDLSGLVDEELARTIATDAATWIEGAGIALIAWGRAVASGPLVKRRRRAN